MEKTPSLEEQAGEQTSQDSIRSELSVPFEKEYISSDDLKRSNVNKRYEVEEDTESSVTLEPSFASSTTISTSLSLTPEELEYLQKIRKSKPPMEMVTLTKSNLRTETMFNTRTLTMMQAGRETVTTLVTAAGLTTLTDISLVTTSTIPATLLAPATTVISSPISFTTVVTESIMSTYNIRFRNEFITRTLVNTRLVTTMTTSYVTRTHAILPFQSSFITLTESHKSPIKKRRTNILTRRRNISNKW